MSVRLLLEPIRDVTVGIRPVKQMTPNLLAAIVADYYSGLTVYELAQKHGLHRDPATVKKMLNS